MRRWSAITRNEAIGRIAIDPVTLNANYIFIGADPLIGAPDDREELSSNIRLKLTDNWRISLEAKNILDEERLDSRAVDGNTLQALSYGPRLFFGVTAKF